MKLYKRLSKKSKGHPKRQPCESSHHVHCQKDALSDKPCMPDNEILQPKAERSFDIHNWLLKIKPYRLMTLEERMEKMKKNLWYPPEEEEDPECILDWYKETPSFVSSFGSPYSTLRRDMPPSNVKVEEPSKQGLLTTSTTTFIDRSADDIAQQQAQIPFPHDNSEHGTHQSVCSRPWFILGFDSEEELHRYQAGDIIEKKELEPQQYTHPAFYVFFAINKLCPAGKEYIAVDYSSKVGLLKSQEIDPYIRRIVVKREQEYLLCQTLLPFFSKGEPVIRHPTHVTKLYIQLQHWSGMEYSEHDSMKPWQYLLACDLKWKTYIYASRHQRRRSPEWTWRCDL